MLSAFVYKTKTITLLLLLELSEALEKMKGVYEQNPQMGDPASLEPQITETAQNIGRLRGELAKYEVIALRNMYLHMLIPTYIQYFVQLCKS